MDFKDYYAILEVDTTADEPTIKKAFRKLARKYHPDVNPGDKVAEEKFKEINEAYAVLSDPKKKVSYDRYSATYGKDWEQGEAFEQAKKQAGRGGGQQNPFGDQGSSFRTSGKQQNFSDLIEEMFGAQGAFNTYKRGQGSQRFAGADTRARLRLPLEEIYEDRQQVVSVGEKNIRLTIPAGVADGQTIRIKGQGQSTPNGQKGDLFITFEIEEPLGFRREGSDLFVDVSVDLYTAVLGGKVDLKAPDGKVRFTVQPETQNGTRIRLKGKGVPHYKQEGRGDLYAIVDITLPQNIGAQEREYLKKAAEAASNNN